MNTKALRQKILDLAIHGKLVPQDPNDEPASVLLERIRSEKERLIKEGKIKKPKKSKAACDKPHYPYELPKGWAITDIGELLINRDGERKPVSSAIRCKQKDKVYDYYFEFLPQPTRFGCKMTVAKKIVDELLKML